MPLLVSQPIDVGVVLVGVVMAALLITVVALGMRNRRQRLRREASSPQPGASQPLGIAMPNEVDAAALMAAIGEAEAEGQHRRLPGLYLSLAQWQLDSGETRGAEDLLRKSIRASTTVGLKDTHAKARLALGDIAHTSGDLATACEHWQIARSLFLELRQTRDHDAVEARMRRNGCPTDWVLTDF